ncbi:MAG: hypothetical protein K6T88_04120 [Bacillus sp. (in: Bacteria)]|nr:hypothetical protein [Bacillus sp. (in: firmicutes)]
MRKRMLIMFSVFFLLSTIPISGVYAVKETTKEITISKLKEDITGDGKKETIHLKGSPYQANPNNEGAYFKFLTIEVASSDNKTYKFSLDSGSKASLQLIDLNNDGVKDLFASVLTGGSEGTTLHFLYSLKDFIYADLTVPNHLEIDSRFLDGYKAEIKITKTNETFLFDLKDREKYYKQLGIYSNQKLNEPMELKVNPYNILKPVYLKGGELGLKGIQRVTGVANTDAIAYVKSTWYFDFGNWKLVNLEVLDK